MKFSRHRNDEFNYATKITSRIILSFQTDEMDSLLNYMDLMEFNQMSVKNHQSSISFGKFAINYSLPHSITW